MELMHALRVFDRATNRVRRGDSPGGSGSVLAHGQAPASDNRPISPERSSWLIGELQKLGLEPDTFRVTREPTVDIVTKGVEAAKALGCDLVIAFGGGSVIDTGKAIAALLTNPGHILDYLEVIGKANPLPFPPAPLVAVPTTAGTGTEVTKNAVIISHQHKVKVSMRSDMMLPRLVVADPELTYSMPPGITASTGLDALTHLIEAYVSRRANPLTDGICKEGLVRAARSLKTAFDDGGNIVARRDMCMASLFSGLVLANAGLGAVHGFAAPLGGRFDAPHGSICARLLPLVMKTNIRALKERCPGSPALARYDEVSRILTGDLFAAADSGLEWIERICRHLDVPPLSTMGLSRADIPGIVTASMRASSMKGNPVELTYDELTDILEQVV